MKKILLPVLALGLILVLGSNKLTEAKANPHVPPGAVVFEAQIYHENGLPKNYVVIVTSQGKNAPLIRPGTELATVMETLLGQGFEIQNITGLHFMAIRR